MGHVRRGWLNSHFHFSFAEYHNPDNMQFGVLRVLNDDIVRPGTGFDPHGHNDMEIVSYVVDGELTHTDSMGSERTLTRGQAQYMSAGTGVIHGEHNRADTTLRFLQTWILPSKDNRTPYYGDYPFEWEHRLDRWLLMASGKEGAAPIQIHADVNIYSTYISPGNTLKLPLAAGRQAYLVLIEGTAKAGDQPLAARDAMEYIEEDIEIQASAEEAAHIYLIEMKKA